MHSSLWQFLESRLRASQDSSGKLVEDEDASAFQVKDQDGFKETLELFALYRTFRISMT